MSSWPTSSPVAEEDLDLLVDGEQYRWESPSTFDFSPSKGLKGAGGSLSGGGWTAGGGVPPAEESTPLLCGNGSAAAAKDNHNAAAGKHPNPDQERNDDSPGINNIFSDDYDLAGGSPRADCSPHVAGDGIVASMATEMANLNVGWKCPRGDDDDDDDDDDGSESTDAVGVTEYRENEDGKGLSLSPNSSPSVRDLASPTGWEPVPSPDSMTSSVDISPFTVDAGDTTNNQLGFVGAGMPFDNADAMDLMSVLGAEKSPSTLATAGNINIAATNSFSYYKKVGVDSEPIGGTKPYKEVTKGDGSLTEEWNGSLPSISASSLPTPLPSVGGSPYSLQPSSDSIANNRHGMDGDDSDGCRNANDSIGSGGDSDGGDWPTEYGNSAAVVDQPGFGVGGVENAAAAEYFSPSDDRSVRTEDIHYILTGVSNNNNHTDMERDAIAAITPATAGDETHDAGRGLNADGGDNGSANANSSDGIETHDAGGGVNADGGDNGSVNGGGNDTAAIIRKHLATNTFVPLDLILDTGTAKPRLKLIIQCTELFVLTKMTADKYSENNAISVAGQVGIRCALCKNEKDKGEHNFSLLTKPKELYNQVKNLSILHFEKTCTCIDEETARRLSIKDKGRNKELGPKGMETMLNELSMFDTIDVLGDRTMRVLSSSGDDPTGDDMGEEQGLGQTETELDSGDAEEIKDDEVRNGKSADALRRQADRNADKLKRNQVARGRLAAHRASEPPPMPMHEANAAIARRTKKNELQKTRRQEKKSDSDE